jgi:general L-amino acid transport system ATP-binding protein
MVESLMKNAGDEPPLVTLERVNKWYGARQVLRDLSLAIAPRERLVVCGPSGSGKSTLLRCINGLESHQQGLITVSGIKLTREPASGRLIRREVGMVFQAFNLFPHLTVLENCTLAPMWVRKLSRAAATALALDYLDRVHVSQHSDKYPGQLSGGEQQRVAIARALCMAPKIMLFDEPTSALDPEMIREVLDTIVAVAESGMSMICVTHEMGFARRVADRMVFMDHGEIVEQGAPNEMFDHPSTDRLRVFLSQILHGHVNPGDGALSQP